MAAGRPAEAFGEHLLAPLAMACAAVLGVAWGYEAAAGRRVGWLRRAAFSSRVAWTLAAVLLAYHAVRMVRWGLSGELLVWIQGSPLGRAVAWIAGFFAG
jgi:hypothetical protein